MPAKLRMPRAFTVSCVGKTFAGPHSRDVSEAASSIKSVDAGREDASVKLLNTGVQKAAQRTCYSDGGLHCSLPAVGARHKVAIPSEQKRTCW